MTRMTTALVALCAVVGLAGCGGGEDPKEKQRFYDSIREVDGMADTTDTEIDDYAETVCESIQVGLDSGKGLMDAMDLSFQTSIGLGLSEPDALMLTLNAMGIGCPELAEQYKDR